jgi:hypothetical protein
MWIAFHPAVCLTELSWSSFMHGERLLQTSGRNPFYLLSALFMLLGCFALSHHLALVSGLSRPRLILIGVLHVYELMQLALALYLNEGGRVRADAKTLFLLGLSFLVDATHLNAEIAASNPCSERPATLGVVRSPARRAFDYGGRC